MFDKILRTAAFAAAVIVPSAVPALAQTVYRDATVYQAFFAGPPQYGVSADGRAVTRNYISQNCPSHLTNPYQSAGNGLYESANGALQSCY